MQSKNKSTVDKKELCVDCNKYHKLKNKVTIQHQR